MNSNNKAAVSLTTGLEDPERVTVAFLVAVTAAETGRPTMMFLAKDAVRLAISGLRAGTACDGCPSLPELVDRYERAGGRYLVCGLCVDAKTVDPVNGAEVGGTVQLWEWIGDGEPMPWLAHPPHC